MESNRKELSISNIYDIDEESILQMLEKFRIYIINNATPGPKGADGINGSNGKNGPKGEKGDKGDSGNSFIITGQANTTAELPFSAPYGTAYFVGTQTPRPVYVYLEPGQWSNQGPLQGLKGDKGDPGRDGKDGKDNIPKIELIIQNGDLYCRIHGNINTYTDRIFLYRQYKRGMRETLLPSRSNLKLKKWGHPMANDSPGYCTLPGIGNNWFSTGDKPSKWVKTEWAPTSAMILLLTHAEMGKYLTNFYQDGRGNRHRNGGTIQFRYIRVTRPNTAIPFDVGGISELSLSHAPECNLSKVIKNY